MDTPATKPAPSVVFMSAFEDNEPTISERRRHRRHDLRADVIFSRRDDFYTYAGFTHDVSEGGVFLATEHLMPVGQLVALTITIPGFLLPLEATAEVRWVRELSSTETERDPRLPAGMGLRFLELPRQTRDSIARIVLR